MSRESKYGCLIGALLAMALIAGLIWFALKSAEEGRRRLEEQVATYAREDFQRVKTGEHYAHIWTAEQISMLAADPDCVRNATIMSFAMNEIAGPNIDDVKKLVNVREITFYDLPVDNILFAMEGMPSIEEMHFDSTMPTEKSIRAFTTFPNLKKLKFGSLYSDLERSVRAAVPAVTIEVEYTPEGQALAPAK